MLIASLYVVVVEEETQQNLDKRLNHSDFSSGEL